MSNTNYFDRNHRELKVGDRVTFRSEIVGIPMVSSGTVKEMRGYTITIDRGNGSLVVFNVFMPDENNDLVANYQSDDNRRNVWVELKK